MRTLFLSLILFLGILSCEKDEVINEISTDAQLKSDLLNSPDSINLIENTLIMTTYLWRDFMPGSHDENGSGLYCVFRVQDSDSSDISNEISLKKLYVINQEEIWITEKIEKQEGENYTINGSVRNGPKWGPDISVDVVSEFESSGKVHRIIAKSQLINKTQ